MTRLAEGRHIRIVSEEETNELNRDSYTPENKLVFRQPTKQLEVVGCGDFYDFLRRYGRPLGINVFFDRNTPAKQCADAAERIKSSWSSKTASAESSAVEQICTAIKSFDAENSPLNQENYNKYIKFLGVKEILDSFWSSISMSERRIVSTKIRRDIVGRLNAVLMDRPEALAAFEEFCREKQVILPIEKYAEEDEPKRPGADRRTAADERPPEQTERNVRRSEALSMENPGIGLRLVANIATDNVHVTVNQKKTLCGIKFAGQSMYWIDGLMRNTGQISCSVCARLAEKEIMKYNRRQ